MLSLLGFPQNSMTPLFMSLPHPSRNVLIVICILAFREKGHFPVSVFSETHLYLFYQYIIAFLLWHAALSPSGYLSVLNDNYLVLCTSSFTKISIKPTHLLFIKLECKFTLAALKKFGSYWYFMNDEPIKLQLIIQSISI